MDAGFLLKPLRSYQWKFSFFNEAKIYFLLIWLMTPIFFPFVISRFSQPIYQCKYTIVASLAFYLLVARGINNLPGKMMKLTTISIIIAVSSMHAWGYYSRINKEQWRDVAEYIGTHADRNDMILVSPSYYMVPFNYYDHNVLPVKKGFPSDGRKMIDHKDVGRLRDIVARRSRIWLVLSDRGDKEQKIANALTRSYKLSLHKEYRHISLYLFDKGDTRMASRLPGS